MRSAFVARAVRRVGNCGHAKHLMAYLNDYRDTVSSVGGIRRLSVLIILLGSVAVEANVANAASSNAADGHALVTTVLSVPSADPSSEARFLECASSSVCYADGRSGRLLKTHDGGNTWSTLTPDPLLGDVESMDCQTESTCVAVESTGRIRITTNGGLSWGPVEVAGVPPDASFDVQCPSASVCYLIANARFDVDSRFWRSGDGGESWDRLGLPAGGARIVDVSCPTSVSCRLVDWFGRVFGTEDGGGSWTDWHAPVGPSPADPVQLACPSAVDCLLLRDDSSASLTQDAGNSWSVENPPGFVKSVACSSAVRCVAFSSDGLSPVSGVVGWDLGGAGSMPFAFPSAATTALMSCAGLHCVVLGATGRISMLALLTDDGGATWREAAEHSTSQIGGIGCVDKMNCVAGASRQSIDRVDRSVVYVTSDGGATWRDRPGPSGWQGIGAVECMGSGRCLVLGYTVRYLTAEVAFTDDFGITWHEVTPSDGESFRLNQTVSCSVNGHCLLRSDDALFISPDAGSTWSLVFGGVSGVIYPEGSCSGTGICMAVRLLPSGPQLVMSRDSGRSWDVRSVPVSGATWATVRCSSNARCFVGIETPSLKALFSTNNGGDSWSRVSSESVPLWGGWADCIENLRCLAVTSYGGVSVSTTGGETWASLSVDTLREAKAILRIDSCPTADLCFASSIDTIERIDLGFPQTGGFGGLSPARLLDSRPGYSTVDGLSAGVGVRPDGSVTELVVTGRGGVPFGAQAVVLNVTVTEARGSGFLTVWPCGEAQPNASSLNYVSGQTVANAVTARVGVGGKVCLFAQTATHLVVDAGGSFG